MLARISFLTWALLSATGVDANGINKENGNINANSEIGRHIMSKARKLANNQNYDYSDFLSGYSVKFQGCHQIQQWNSDADENDVRIMTKRLVRFRVCPASDCSSDLYGCTSYYGDYVIDMETFVSAYVESQQQMYAERKLEDYDLSDYTQCSQLGDYYIGPFCADQGGEIQFGLFYDDTCTSSVENGDELFYETTGFSLPYSDSSIVSLSCMPCLTYVEGDDDQNGDDQDGDDQEDEYVVSEFCENIYASSGKCETKMDMSYPNENSCSYIEGIKIIRADGVIRTGSTKKSKAAAICIGLFLTIAVLLAGYVYYLRTSKF